MATSKELWIERPDSARIARELDSQHAGVCQHGRDPCYLRCGVRRTREGWRVIMQSERLRWAGARHRP